MIKYPLDDRMKRLLLEVRALPEIIWLPWIIEELHCCYNSISAIML